MLPRTVAQPQSITYKTLVGTIAAVVVGVAFVVQWYVDRHIPAEIAKQIAPMNERTATELSSMNQRIAKMEGTLETLLKNVTSGSPDEVKKKLTFVRNYLDAAQDHDLVIRPEAIQTAGREILSFQPADVSLRKLSWDTAAQTVQYRSFLNAKLYPTGQATGIGSGPPVIVLGPPCCHLMQRVVVEGGGPFALDWVEWDTVVFANTRVRYSGNPMKLKNVHFENCTFEIADTPAGKAFSLALLASPSVEIDLDHL